MMRSKIRKKLNIILISIFLCVDLIGILLLLKEIFLVDEKYDNPFIYLVFFLIWGIVFIPYYVSQLLIIYGTNILLNYRVKGITKLCVLLSVGISSFLFVWYVFIPFFFGIDFLPVSIPFEWGVMFVALALYILGKHLFRRTLRVGR